eukprot:2860665-Pyramimonas_sp.AAC.1
MQLVRATPEIFRRHQEALQILTAGPRHALTTAITFRVSSKCRALESALHVRGACGGTSG